MVKRSAKWRSLAVALATGVIALASTQKVAAQAGQVYAPGTYGAPQAQTQYQPQYQPQAQLQYQPQYQPQPQSAPQAAYPTQTAAQAYEQGYRPPAFNPAWVPKGYGANQALPVQDQQPIQSQPAYAPPPPPPPPPMAYAPQQQTMAYAQPRPYSSRRFAEWSDSDYRYRISAGDELSVRFLLNPDLNTAVQVGPDGQGVFPLISSVRVADMTVEQANGVLSQAYAQILRRPDVQVLITTYGSSQVYVGGEVRNPGVYPLRGKVTPAQAVMMAGGLSTTARLGRVAIIRQRPDGQMLMKEIDLQAYLTKGQGMGGFTILPGDLIFVPRSSIAEVDRFVDQYITGLLPLGRVLGYRDPTPITY